MADIDLERLEARVAELERAAKPASSDRNGKDWDAYAAVIATFIGILALAVAGYTSYLQRRQLQAQVWPRLGIGGSNVDAKMFVINQGTGPARITAMRVTVDGRPMRTWADVVRAFGFGDADILFYSALSNERVIPAGQTVELYSPIPGDENNKKRLRDIYEQKGHSCGITICYCSVLDDCWVARQGSVSKGELKRPDDCPVGPTERFQE
jgi:hypothetical protein